ncbi:hypothetical protein HJC23_013318 [Cyclotella cryptica]|uniref:SGNH hydrolase-type esterase domain-containing protein n=1 Tax=Cyclotella cryptica TaxID=29204 RepID=A0ABD3Q286_9STRA|eukprot:CCRYP_009725-RA/>CCRYP_009725-RA protein AED:0.00 eAED:0.00 QI:1783/1/1/1/1/1/2/158/647
MIFPPSTHQRFDVWHTHVPHVSRQYSRPYRMSNFGLGMNVDSFAETNALLVAGVSCMISSTQTVIPTIVDALSNLVISLTSYAATIASMVLRLSIRFQDLGETLLTAFLILSILQAGVALYQYRYDARGQLVFPDGPTLGVEDYFADTEHSRSDTESKPEKAEKNGNEVKDEAKEDGDAVKPDIYSTPYFLQKLNKSLLLLLPWITSNIHNLLTKNSHLFHIGFIITLVRFLEDTMLGSDDGDYNSHDDDPNAILPPNTTSFELNDQNEETGGWNWNFLGWLAREQNYKATKYSSDRVKGEVISTAFPSLLEKLAENNKDPLRVLVIGDSLAVGIGCIEVFDPTKVNSTPMALVENITPLPQQVKSNKSQTPVFPQMLARTLSYYCHRPVHWRSGGVDGGDINDIRKFCMDIIRHECAAANNGRNSIKLQNADRPYLSGPPDIIVVLFGMNDLKNLVSINFLPQIFHRDKAEDGGGGIAYHFRRGMEALINDIRSYSPNAYIVFPQLPIQTFHKNSIVNILPLGVVVDSMVGYWEGQKRRVMEGKNRKKGTISERNTMYIDLDAKEIADWYSTNNREVNGNNLTERNVIANECYDDIQDDVLISADGVHPNKRMYAKWSETVGKKIFQRIIPQLELIEQKQQMVANQ